MLLSKKIRPVLILCAIVAVGVPMCRPLWGQEEHSIGRANTLETAHDFLRTTYPALVGQGRFLTLCVNQRLDDSYRASNEITFEIRPFDPEVTPTPLLDPKTGKRLEAAKNNPVLGGVFHFDEDAQIEWVSTDALDKNKRYLAVRDLVQSHREWSEADANQALKHAGARYTSDRKDLFLEAAHLDRLEKFLGRVQVISTDFRTFVNPDHEGDFVLLYWEVRVDARMPDGRRRTYSLLFDPFEGELVSLRDVDSH